jgi:hypothetical protein
MEQDIVSKLNNEIRQGLVKEKDVTYFLIQCRKLLDRQSNKSSYLILRFYSNWVVHHEIEDLKEFNDFFLKISKLVNDYLNNQETKIRHEINNLIAEFLSFTVLRNDLINFTHDQGIDQDFLKNHNKWLIFCKLLKEIVLDCQLDFKRIRKMDNLSKLKTFRITRDNIFQLQDGLPFLPWEIWIITSPLPMTGFIPE